MKTLVALYTMEKGERTYFTRRWSAQHRQMRIQNDDPTDPTLNLGDVSEAPPEGRMHSESGPRNDRAPYETVKKWSGKLIMDPLRRRINHIVISCKPAVTDVREEVENLREPCAIGVRPDPTATYALPASIFPHCYATGDRRDLPEAYERHF